MSTEKSKAVLLFSGGIDSLCAYFYLNKPQTVFFDLSTVATEFEFSFILSVAPDVIVDYSLNLHDREQGEKAYIPFRNFLMAAQATHYADNIFIAGLKDDQVSDKNEPIFRKMSTLFSEMEGRQIRIISPFWEMTKIDIVGWYLDNVGDVGLLLRTVSCYRPDESEDCCYCGACPSCFRKWIALRENGIFDLNFYNQGMLQYYYDRAKSGQYVDQRNRAIIRQIDAYRR